MSKTGIQTSVPPQPRAHVADVRQRLHEIIRKRSFGRGEITLASGRKSDFYFNLKPTMLDAEGAALLAELTLDALGMALETHCPEMSHGACARPLGGAAAPRPPAGPAGACPPRAGPCAANDTSAHTIVVAIRKNLIVVPTTWRRGSGRPPR